MNTNASLGEGPCFSSLMNSPGAVHSHLANWSVNNNPPMIKATDKKSSCICDGLFNFSFKQRLKTVSFIPFNRYPQLRVVILCIKLQNIKKNLINM